MLLQFVFFFAVIVVAAVVDVAVAAVVITGVAAILVHLSLGSLDHCCCYLQLFAGSFIVI